jgi:GPH family glycoside/pentoside/hexuronide:cation symporter
VGDSFWKNIIHPNKGERRMNTLFHTEKLQTKEKLPTRQVFGYLSGMVPTVLIIGFFGFAYSKFFLNDLKLDPKLWYIGLAIYGIVNALNDPIIGYISDSTNAKKWGSRRLIYIKWGAPLLALAFALIWWIPTNHGSQFLLFLHFTLSLCFYDTLMTMVVMTWMSLLPEMTMDVDERTKINLISTIVVFFFGLPLLAVSTFNHEQIKVASLIIAVISPFMYFLVVKFCKEKPEFQQDPPVPFLKAAKLTLWNRAFLCVIGMNFVGQLSSTMTSAFTFMFWYIIGEKNILWYYLCSVIIGYISNVIAMRLREKAGMINLMIAYGLMQVIGGLVIFFLVLNPAREWLIWVGIVWNAFFGGASVFRGAMQMLVIDQDELRSGQRREGMFYGMNALLVKPAESFGPALGTAIMLAFAYVQGAPAASQPASVLLGIKIIFLLIPQVVTLISLFILGAYPIKGQKLTDLQKELEEKHTQKKEALIAAGASDAG